MGLFHDELKKMLNIKAYADKTKFFARDAMIPLMGNRIAKADFVTGTSANRYVGLRMRIIHRVYGLIDQSVFLFSDSEPNNYKDLFLYESNRYKDESWWNNHHEPSNACYADMQARIETYLSLFDVPNDA